MSRSASSNLPDPLVAGIGFVAQVPAALTAFGLRLPALAFQAAQTARQRYDEYLRIGAAVLGLDEDQDGQQEPEEADAEGGGAPVAPFERTPFEAAAADRVEPPASSPDARDLPLENYSALTLGQIRARMARLSADEVRQLRDYEAAHGRRLPVLTMLENRLAKLG